MSRKFNLEKDYYDEGYDLYRKETITLNPGVTVLVGCNGTGKTTLMHQIQSQLKNEDIPCISFDNLHDGGSKAISSAAFFEDFGFVATAACSSEGENIIMNIAKMASRLRHFIKTGEDNGRESKLEKAFEKLLKDDINEEKEVSNERWILLDAIDSGLSVDNIVEVKEDLFKIILEDYKDGEVYIIVSANEYEMARGEQCFNVHNGEYVTFPNYEEYRDFILLSRKWKDDRYEKE